jgi:phosphatidylserine/phosphatidylglycerophosphate/cardiolipin synthase-like enzyme
VQNHYFGLGPSPWRSREIYAGGEEAARAQRYARRLHESRHSAPPLLARYVGPAAAGAAGEALDAFRELALEGLGRWSPRAMAVEAARFIHDYNSKGDRNGTHRELVRLLYSAKKEIVLETPYLALTPEITRALKRAIQKNGVRVSIVTNSRKTNDHRIAQWAYEAQSDFLTRLGVTIHEYQGPGTLHAKAALVDGKTAFVGSYNFNRRSARMDWESGLLVEDERFAGRLMDEIRIDIGNSQPPVDPLASRWYRFLRPALNLMRDALLLVLGEQV